MKISANTFAIAAILFICVNQVCYCPEEQVPEVQMSSFSTVLWALDSNFAGLAQIAAMLAKAEAGPKGTTKIGNPFGGLSEVGKIASKAVKNSYRS